MLIIALGADYHPEVVPGLEQGSFNLCFAHHNVEIKKALEELEEDKTVVVAVPRMPYKCPLAPLEWALVTHSLLQNKGIREKVSFLVSIFPALFPILYFILLLLLF